MSDVVKAASQSFQFTFIITHPLARASQKDSAFIVLFNTVDNHPVSEASRVRYRSSNTAAHLVTIFGPSEKRRPRP